MTAIWQMSAEEFVGTTMVSDSFGDDDKADAIYAKLCQIGSLEKLPILWASDCRQFTVRELPWKEVPSLALYVGSEPIGFYRHGRCWLKEQWRGQGLATEMTLCASDVAGGSPTNAEGNCMTERELNVHYRAHAIAIQRAADAGLPVPEARKQEAEYNQERARFDGVWHTMPKNDNEVGPSFW